MSLREFNWGNIVEHFEPFSFFNENVIVFFPEKNEWASR